MFHCQEVHLIEASVNTRLYMMYAQACVLIYFTCTVLGIFAAGLFPVGFFYTDFSPLGLFSAMPFPR